MKATLKTSVRAALILGAVAGATRASAATYNVSSLADLQTRISAALAAFPGFKFTSWREGLAAMCAETQTARAR